MAAILVFFCLLENEPLLPRLRENILLNFEFKNEPTRANLQVNKRILKWRPFWNKVCETSFFTAVKDINLQKSKKICRYKLYFFRV